MNTQQKHRHDHAKQQFENVVWPILSHTLTGYLISVEDKQEEIANTIDRECSIDYLYKPEGGIGQQGFSVRVNYQGRDYRSFAVRRPEWPKLMLARSGEFITSTFTIQAYTDGVKLLSAGMIKTKDLAEVAYEMRRSGLCGIHELPEGSHFYSLPWRIIQDLYQKDIQIWQ